MIIQLSVVKRLASITAIGLFAAACEEIPTSNAVDGQLTGEAQPSEQFLEGYGPVYDDGYNLPGIPAKYTQGSNARAYGTYNGTQPPGTIEIDPYAKFLYYVLPGGKAWRYPIAVGRGSKGLSFNTTVQLKRHWPGWTPTQNMVRTEPEVYGPFAQGVPGGLRSPLGARALYLYRNGKDTYYRIHGTNDLNSIGNSGSAGCIRLFNQDIIHLYDQVQNGARVVIRSRAESVRIEDPWDVDRGVELPPVILDPDEYYGAAAQAADRAPQIDENRNGIPDAQE